MENQDNLKELLENTDKEVIKDIEAMDNNKNTEKKFSISKLIVPIAIIMILAVFAGIVYYQKVVVVEKELLSQMGYGATSMKDFKNNYITLGKYTDLSYEITQEMWDEYVANDTQNWSTVKRAAKDTDQVTFNVIGYVEGEKVDDLVLKDQEITIGEETDGVFAALSKLLKGKSAGDVLHNVKGLDANQVSTGGVDYSDAKVRFDVKVVSVSELEVEEITDEWVKDLYLEDYGWETTKDYYEGVKESLKNEAISNLWQQVIDNSVVKKYPEDSLSRIIDEVQMDNNFNASEWGMSLQDYYDTWAITEEDLEEQYTNELASEMIAWAIAYEEGLTEISKAEMEETWESMYEDLGYNSVEEMKADRDEKEIIRAIILDRASKYVYEHSKVVESYTVS